MAVFSFGLLTVLSGTAQSGTESASLGAGLEGASARHSSLPFGTRLKVMHPETGREVEVIVTGRLPEDAPQSFEISEGAAEKLGISPEEVSTELHYQVQVPKAPPAPAVPSISGPSAGAGAAGILESAVVLPPARIIPGAPDPECALVYRVQVGSYKSVANARAAFDRLNNAGFRAAYERFNGSYRVVISGVPASGIPAAARRLGAAGFSEIWIRPEN
jgi:cell division septation protein DedD